MIELFNNIVLGLLILVPLVNPVSTVALFIILSSNMTKQAKDRQALLASIYVFL